MQPIQRLLPITHSRNLLCWIILQLSLPKLAEFGSRMSPVQWPDQHHLSAAYLNNVILPADLATTSLFAAFMQDTDQRCKHIDLSTTSLNPIIHSRPGQNGVCVHVCTCLCHLGRGRRVTNDQDPLWDWRGLWDFGRLPNLVHSCKGSHGLQS